MEVKRCAACAPKATVAEAYMHHAECNTKPDEILRLRRIGRMRLISRGGRKYGDFRGKFCVYSWDLLRWHCCRF